LKKAK
jgi:hypothetical protein